MNLGIRMSVTANAITVGRNKKGKKPLPVAIGIL